MKDEKKSVVSMEKEAFAGAIQAGVTGCWKGGDKMHSRTRIFIVDDHPAMRHGIAQLLANEKDFDVWGQAGDWQETAAALAAASPDFMILDIGLKDPDRSGLDLIPLIHSVSPGLPILIYSMYDEKIYAERALRAGARGYLMKQEPVGKIVEAIRRIIKDGIYISEAVNRRIVLDHVGFPGSRERQAAPENLLSPRELEIFRLIGQGLQPREIARELCISTKTVETHRTKIRRKMNLAGAPELIRYAIKYAQSMS